jgi:excisionase family DNA binding protein
MNPSASSREPWSWDQFPDLMTSRDCMKALNVSENTLYELCRSGMLRTVAVHVGRQLRFPKSALRRVLGEE